jgi:hypothetical protein
MSSVDELMAWLLEQLAADERGDGFAHCTGCEGGGVEFMGTMYECDIDAARARVLREVESKRALLNEYDAALAQRKSHPDDLATAGWLLATIRVAKRLGLAYADREGFRDEWRP